MDSFCFMTLALEQDSTVFNITRLLLSPIPVVLNPIQCDTVDVKFASRIKNSHFWFLPIKYTDVC